MKIVYIEMNAEEMRSNKGVMDILTDALGRFADGMFGTYADTTKPDSAEDQEDE